MSFSLDFSSPISTGDFHCLDDYMLSHSVNEYKTYSDLCSLSLSSITSLQTALNLIKTAVTDLLSMPQSFTYLKNISTFISLKIISNQLSDILHTVVSSEKKFIFMQRRTINEKESNSIITIIYNAIIINNILCS